MHRRTPDGTGFLSTVGGQESKGKGSFFNPCLGHMLQRCDMFLVLSSNSARGCSWIHHCGPATKKTKRDIAVQQTFSLKGTRCSGAFTCGASFEKLSQLCGSRSLNDSISTRWALGRWPHILCWCRLSSFDYSPNTLDHR